MARVHETAYPQLKPHYSKRELEEVFTPMDDDIAYMRQVTRDTLPKTQLCFMGLLKGYQCLGRPVAIGDLPESVIQYIAKELNIKATKKLKYSKATRQRHLEAIRRYLQINNDNHARKRCMKKASLAAAETKENLADIINEIIDHLIKEHFEIPAYQGLLRLARASRKVMARQYDQKIAGQLSSEVKEFLDALFNVSRENVVIEQKIPLVFKGQKSPWWQIKQEAKTPTSKSIRAFIRHLNGLLTLRQSAHFDLNSIPPARVDTLVSEAISLDASDMKQLRANHRYALAIVLINMKVATSVDDLCRTLILWIRRFHTDAKEELDEYRRKHADEVDRLITVLHGLSVDVKNSQSEQEQLSAIDKNLNDRDAIIEQCEKHMAYANDNYYSFMLRPYQNKRSLLLKIIDHLDIHSTTHDTTIKTSLQFIDQHRQTKKEWIELTYQDENNIEATVSLDWLSEKWFKMVTGKSPGTKVTKIHHYYFELAVMEEIAEALDSGDAYVNNGYAFDDPNKQLMSWEAFYEGVDAYCALIKQPKEPEQFTANLQTNFREVAQRVDRRCPENHYLSIEEGLPILKRARKKKYSKEAKRISDKIDELIPQTNIVEVILTVERWFNLSKHVKPLSGFETKMENHDLCFVAALFAYGCNIGPSEGSRCLIIFSRKQIARIFNRQITEQKLDFLNIQVINEYNKFDMPKQCWGPGESLSVDATFWEMFKKNLLAAHHIRYGGFGGLGYYHISDSYIALYGNFISCGVHESHYLFDGIIDNDSEIQPKKVHGDTGAQTEVAFGFGYLLAIFLMPRIRNFKHLRYYKPNKTDHFTHLNELFCDESIDWDFMQLHYHDMLRVVMSVHAGRVKASTILRRMGSKTRKNKLYYAFRELGRVVRSMFLLNYIDDMDLRKTIHAGTCKSEEFNQFISWVRFGDGGMVGDNLRFNQQKIIKFGHLVANMVSLHTTASMTKAVNTLKQQGEAIPDEILGAYSPFRTGYINRRGIFPLDFNNKTMALEHELFKD